MEAHSIIKSGELTKHSLTRHQLNRGINSGRFEKVGPGLFIKQDDDLDPYLVSLAALSAKSPEATICLVSALVFHELTDEIPSVTNIAIPKGVHPVITNHKTFQWHRFQPETFAIGRSTWEFDFGGSIGIYSAKRTIIDLFRTAHLVGQDLALTSLKRWLKRPASNPGELLRMAKLFPKAYPSLQKTLEILV